jgi:hypothetical protein
VHFPLIPAIRLVGLVPHRYECGLGKIPTHLLYYTSNFLHVCWSAEDVKVISIGEKASQHKLRT